MSSLRQSVLPQSAGQARRAKLAGWMGLAGAAALLAVAGSSGCTPAVRAPQAASLAGVVPTTGQILELLARRDRKLSTFRAEAKLDYESPTRRFRSSQTIAVRAPDSIRIDVMNPFGVSYTVATDGQRLEAFDRRNNLFYEGSATTENIRRYTGVPLPPVELAALVRGLPPSLGAQQGGTIEGAEGAWLWRRSLSQGRTLELWLDAEHWDPVRLRVIDHNGTDEVDATLGDYEDLNGLRVVRRMDVSFADGGRLQLSYKKVWRKVEIAPDAFRIQKPARARWIDMDKEGSGG